MRHTCKVGHNGRQVSLGFACGQRLLVSFSFSTSALSTKCLFVAIFLLKLVARAISAHIGMLHDKKTSELDVAGIED